MRIAVIGAGASGLCTARHGSKLDFVREIVVFEQTKDIGGTWVYTDNIGLDDNGLPIHSSMYKHMRSNFPLNAMQFPDFPADLLNEESSFVSHRKVHDYLKSYAENFDLHKYIRFQTHVLSIEVDENESWTVISVELPTKITITEIFDAVFICNGHYSDPKQLNCAPYPAATLHSHDYRTPKPFSGKIAACLGAGPSGIDIAIELGEVCETVYLCHNKPRFTGRFPSRIKQKTGFSKYHKNHVELVDGDTIAPDVIVYCTGYNYSFPFLKGSAAVDTTDDRLRPLYQHLIHIEHNSLIFIGVCKHIIPFPLFEVQIQFAYHVLSGKHKLPSKDEMYAWEESDFQKKVVSNGLKTNKAHHLGNPGQWEYCQNLADLAGFKNPIPSVVSKIFTKTDYYRFEDPVGYKNIKFTVLDDDNFTVTMPDSKPLQLHD